MWTQVGSCPGCGAPIYVPTVWHGVTPPPPHYTCECRMRPLPMPIVIPPYAPPRDRYTDWPPYNPPTWWATHTVSSTG